MEIIGLAGTTTGTRPQEDSLLSHFPQDFASEPRERSNPTQLWTIPCFESSEFGTKAVHENVTGGRYDFQVFKRFRDIYFRERSRFRRFFGLREIIDIKFINASLLKSLPPPFFFRILTIWPVRPAFPGYCQHSPNRCLAPRRRSQPLVLCALSCKTIPLVGHKILMHLWRNPHHADEAAYREWQIKTGRSKRFLEWFRQLPAPSSAPKSIQQPNEAASASVMGSELPVLRHSAYVFVKIPKKIGDKLEHNYGDREP
jgi:hypothetical protein